MLSVCFLDSETSSVRFETVQLLFQCWMSFIGYLNECLNLFYGICAYKWLQLMGEITLIFKEKFPFIWQMQGHINLKHESHILNHSHFTLLCFLKCKLHWRQGSDHGPAYSTLSVSTYWMKASITTWWKCPQLEFVSMETSAHLQFLEFVGTLLP